MNKRPSFSIQLPKSLVTGLATGLLSTAFIFFLLGLQAASAADGYGSGTGCLASKDWITNPSLPTEVATTETNCDFQQFMWQSFLALMQPASSSNSADKGALLFETWMPSYGIFVDPGKTPAAWGSVPVPSYASDNGYKGNSTNASYVFSDLTLQAGIHQPLIDRNLNDVFYGVLVNKPAYDFITSCDLYKAQCGLTLAPDLLTPSSLSVVDIPKKYPNLAFPNQSIELKTSWKILTDEEIKTQTFYTTKGWVQSPDKQPQENVTLGLLGMHIVSKTPNHPEFIWGTFEHRNNAPDCSDVTATPPLGGDWTFFDASCKDCATNQLPPTGKPSQICRMHPQGDPTIGTFPNGLSCTSTTPPGYICNQDTQQYVIDPNTSNIKALNTSVQAMLQALPAENANRRWANYELVGNIWTDNGVLPPNLMSQRGSLSAANTTMESYVQNGVSGITNPTSCFSCHNQTGRTLISSPNQASSEVMLPPAGLSHIFNLLETDTKGCDNGSSLPAACAIYHQ